MSVGLPLDYEPAWEARVREMVPSQFRDLPRFDALWAAIGAEAQRLEDLAFGVLSGTLLDNARGHALDQWGDLVGESRGALTDDHDYRRFIRARILANRSQGRPGELAEILTLLLEPVEIRYVPLYPATFVYVVVRREYVAESIRRRILLLIADAFPAARTGYVVEALVGYFGFAEDEDARGFGGGPFARVL